MQFPASKQASNFIEDRYTVIYLEVPFTRGRLTWDVDEHRNPINNRRAKFGCKVRHGLGCNGFVPDLSLERVENSAE
jgi:hypothetical protein